MIEFYKRNPVAQFFTIIVIMIAMWWPAFVHPQPMPENSEGVIYRSILWLLEGSAGLSVLFAFLLVGLEGFWFNLILYNCRLIPQNSLMPMLLYVVAMSSDPALATLTPLILNNLLLLLVLHITLVRTELPMLNPSTLFVVSALLALATMVSPYAFYLLLFLVAVIVLFKLYSWREIMVALLGFFAPYVIWLMCYYLTDGLDSAMQSIGVQLGAFHIRIESANWAIMSQNIYFGVLMVVSLMSFDSVRPRSLQVDNINSMLIFVIFFCAICNLFYGTLFPFNQRFFALPFAFVVSVFFVNMPKKIFWSILFTLYIAISIAAKYLVL